MQGERAWQTDQRGGRCRRRTKPISERTGQAAEAEAQKHHGRC